MTDFDAQFRLLFVPQNRLSELVASRRERQELARALGVSERTFYRWQIGETAIPDDQKARVCDLFGITLDRLMCRDEEESNRVASA